VIETDISEGVGTVGEQDIPIGVTVEKQSREGDFEQIAKRRANGVDQGSIAEDMSRKRSNIADRFVTEWQ